MKNKIVYGASGHGKVIADIIEKNGDHVFAFVDDDESLWNQPFYGATLMGGMDRLLAFLDKTDQQFEIIVAIGSNPVRKKVADQLQKTGVTFGTAIHPSAQIGRGVVIGQGTVIMANCAVNPGSVIGAHCIINTGTTVDHDCEIDDFVHLSPGVHLGGTVCVGAMSWCGIGSTVINNINIANNVIIGAGSVVIRNLEPNIIVVGNPATLLRKNEKKK